MNRIFYNQNGSVAMLSVFFIMMMLIIFAFSDQAIAVKESGVAIRAVSSEKAYYAAQGCLEEAYLQLRTDSSFSGNSIATGAVTCNSSVDFDVTTPSVGDGALTARGSYRNTERTIVSNFEGAGPTSSANSAAIYHVIDRSGSMIDDSTYRCSNPSYTDSASCTGAGHTWQWVLEPITTAKSAAISFIHNLDETMNAIGVISFSSNAQMHYPASSNFTAAELAVMNIPDPDGTTNIGAAITLSRTAFSSITGFDSKVSILLTDGKPNVPGMTTNQSADAALAAATSAKNAGIIVITIGLGQYLNEDLLRQMASTEDLYFHAPNASDLTGIYAQILNEITTYNIQQTAWEEQ